MLELIYQNGDFKRVVIGHLGLTGLGDPAWLDTVVDAVAEPSDLGGWSQGSESRMIVYGLVRKLNEVLARPRGNRAMPVDRAAIVVDETLEEFDPVDHQLALVQFSIRDTFTTSALTLDDGVRKLLGTKLKNRLRPVMRAWDDTLANRAPRSRRPARTS